MSDGGPTLGLFNTGVDVVYQAHNVTRSGEEYNLIQYLTEAVEIGQLDSGKGVDGCSRDLTVSRCN